MTNSSTSIYWTEALRQIPRILSHLDRNPASPTYGAFGRLHWSWRVQGMPMASSSYGIYPLAIVWGSKKSGNSYYRNPALLEAITSAIRFWQRLQHHNGSFDQLWPFEQSVGATAYTGLAILRTARLLQKNEASLNDEVWECVKKAADFVLSNDESYGIISNHLALFALFMLEAADVFTNEAYRRRAAQFLDTIRSSFSEEGWFLEYKGPDPGYQTQTLYYLSEVARIIHDDSLNLMIEKALTQFQAFFIHPDGSLGGHYGSRYTEIAYPAGFEMLSATSPEAKAIASSIRQAIERERTVVLQSLDFENLIRLTANYLIADQEASALVEREGGYELPHALPKLRKVMPQAGLVIWGTSSYYAVASGACGGVLTVYRKQGPELRFDDTGYLGQLNNGSMIGTQSHLNAAWEMRDNTLTVSTPFYRLPLEAMSPWKMSILYLCGLFFMRLSPLTNLLKSLLVKRLITRNQTFTGFLFRRSITFFDNKIEIQDVLQSSKKSAAKNLKWVALKKYTPLSMASSGYFHQAQIDPSLSESDSMVPIERLQVDGLWARTVAIDMSMSLKQAAATVSDSETTHQRSCGS